MGKSPEDEGSLFRDTVGEVRRVTNDRSDSRPPRPRPVARFAQSDADAVLEESLHGGPDAWVLGTGEELQYLKPGVSRSVLRKLRRGSYSTEAEIDLHGLNTAEAKQALDDFLDESHARSLRCVRVIHGKGRRSGHRGPVIKNKVNLWLQRRVDIVGFVSARPVDGGTGAIYVLLAKI